MEHDLRHVQEDGLVVFLVGDGVVGLGEENRAGQRNEDGADQGKQHPADAVEAAGAGVGRLAQCHEAHDDVRLSKVAQAPRQVADDDRGRNTGEEREVVGVLNHTARGVGIVSGEAEDLAWVVQGHDGHNRDDDERSEHEQALHGIGVGNSKEAAHEGVEHRHCRDDEHADEVVAAEGRLEVAATRHHARRDIEGEEEYDDRRGKNTQQTGLVVEAVFEEGRHRNRVAGNLRVRAQTRRHPLPVGPCANQ